MNDALAVRLTGIGKDYRHFSLADVDLDLPTGSIMGFIGANGAGKSTTIRILMGLIRQDRGTVEVLGYSMPESLALAKRNIGFVSEDMRLYKCATIAWHMQFIASLFPGWDEAYAKELLRRFDLKREQLVKGLSHGQRVKAALLLALARRPRLLVLDEPTTELDPIARHEVLGRSSKRSSTNAAPYYSRHRIHSTSSRYPTGSRLSIAGASSIPATRKSFSTAG